MILLLMLFISTFNLGASLPDIELITSTYDESSTQVDFDDYWYLLVNLELPEIQTDLVTTTNPPQQN